jgi:hypothetical protein
MMIAVSMVAADLKNISSSSITTLILLLGKMVRRAYPALRLHVSQPSQSSPPIFPLHLLMIPTKGFDAAMTIVVTRVDNIKISTLFRHLKHLAISQKKM